MKKRKKQGSAFGTIALVLLGLALAGFMFNLFNGSAKEDDTIDELIPGETYVIKFEGDLEYEYSAVYSEGMTWGDIASLYDGFNYRGRMVLVIDETSYDVLLDGKEITSLDDIIDFNAIYTLKLIQTQTNE